MTFRGDFRVRGAVQPACAVLVGLVTLFGTISVSGPAAADDPKTALFSSSQSASGPTTASTASTKPRTVGQPASDALAGKIGLIRFQNARPHCTAFCLSKSLIATAGHCIRGTSPEAHPHHQRLVFESSSGNSTNGVAPPRTQSSAILGLVSGGGRVSFRAPIDADQDWALLRLQNPICVQGGIQVSTPSEPSSRSVAQSNLLVPRPIATGKTNVSYTIRPCKQKSPLNRKTAKQIASDFSAPDQLLFHDCDPGPLASGTPILQQTAAGPEIVAMHVGSYVRSRVVEKNSAIIERITSRSVANIAVRVDAFTRSVKDMLDNGTRPTAGLTNHTSD